jgi:hypothetical protein
VKSVNTWARQILQTGFVVIALIFASCLCVLDCQKLRVDSTDTAPPCHQHQTPQKQDSGSHACMQSQVFAADRSLAQTAPDFMFAADVPSIVPAAPALTESWSKSQRADRPPESVKPLLSTVLRV